MSNTYGSNHWVLDTAGTVGGTEESTNITLMEWVPNAAADDLTILDAEGIIVWDVNALTGGTAGKETFRPAKRHRVVGFNLSVIDGGTLTVYFE